MKRKNPKCCSAERPVSRKTSESGSAGRPASSVAYIDCPRPCWIRSLTPIEKAIENAIGVGATIINVTIDREADADVLYRTISRVLQVLWGDAFCAESVGTVMSFYTLAHWELLERKDIDPEWMSPALLLTFRERQSPGLQMTVVTLSLPSLPITARDRLLQTYVDKAVQTNSHRVIIGGVFNAVAETTLENRHWIIRRLLLWLENRVSKLAFDIAVSSNESLCVLPWCTTGSMKCNALDSAGPYALVIEHEPESAEQPVAPTPTKASRGSNGAERSSDEQPAASTPTNASGGSNRSERNSAGQPAASTGTRTSRVSLESRGPGIILNVATPLYDKLLLDLEQTEESSTLIHHIEQHCFFGELRFVSPSGYRAPGAMSFSSKMENLLQISLERRRTIAEAAGLTDEQLLQHRATPSEMREMYNSWRSDVRVWMSTDDRERYFDLLDAGRNQKARQLGKHCFNAYCFHVSGCGFLLSKLIELPIISTASRNLATVLRQLLQDLEDHKKTDAYKAAVQRSEARSHEQQRLSRAIWWAKCNLERGRLLSTKIAEGTSEWSSLSWEDQKRVEDFDCRRAQKALSELEARKSPAYGGTHVESFTA